MLSHAFFALCLITWSNCDVSDWFNPYSGFIKKETNNDLESYISLPGGYIAGYSILNGTTSYFAFTNFPIAIPEGSTIRGIEVQYQVNHNEENVTTINIKLLRNGQLLPFDLADSNTNWSDQEVRTVGGPSQLWGTTWTYSQITSPTFGVTIRYRTNANNTFGTFASFSRISIRITYDIASVTSSSFTTGGAFNNNIVYLSSGRFKKVVTTNTTGLCWNNIQYLSSGYSADIYFDGSIFLVRFSHKKGYGTSNTLFLMNPDVSIPIGATIQGVELKIQASSSFSACFSTVKLVVNSVVQPTNRGQGALCLDSWYLFSNNYFSDQFFGGKNDIWGVSSLAGSSVMSPNFGVSLNIDFNGTSFSPAINDAQLRIYWSGGSNDGVATTGDVAVTSGGTTSVFSQLEFPNLAVVYPANTTSYWNGVSNIIRSDGSTAYSYWSQNAGFSYSDYLVVFDFGFAFKSNIPILGVKVSLDRHADGAACLSDIYLVRNGAIVGQNKGNRAGCSMNITSLWGNSNTFTTDTFGGKTDTWGVTLSPNDVNSPNFGVAIRLEASSGCRNVYASIDSIFMEIFYQYSGSNPIVMTTGDTLFAYTDYKLPGSVSFFPEEQTNQFLDWGNQNAIGQISDGNYASCYLGSPYSEATSRYLMATNFPIGNPFSSGQNVIGIRVFVRAMTSGFPIGCISSIRLILNGSLVGEDRGFGPNCTNSLTTLGTDLPANYTFGGEYDTWGIIFNSTDEVRSPNFGVGVAVKMKSGDPAGGSVNVDAVMIQIIFGFSQGPLTSGRITTGNVNQASSSSGVSSANVGSTVSTETNERLIIPIAVGASIGVILIIVIAIIVTVVIFRRRSKTAERTSAVELKLKEENTDYRPLSIKPVGANYTGLVDSEGGHALPLSASGKPIVETSNRDLLEKKVNIEFASLKMEKEIGQGSFGKVFSGEWQQTQVAIKICAFMDESKIKDFLSEAKVMTELRPHPNVLQLFGVSIDGPHPAIVVEFCSGGSLDRKIYSKDPLTSEFIFKVIKGSALGMLHLHKNGKFYYFFDMTGLIHRDIAARNVLLNASGDPKISDFGLSKFLENKDAHFTVNNNAMPIRWMAPECMKERVFTTASDVYAWGVMLVEIINREVPFKDMDLLGVIEAVRDKGMLPPLHEESEVPEFLKNMVHSCLNHDRNQRPTFDKICGTLNNLNAIHFKLKS